MARDREAKAEWKIPQGKVRGPRSWTRNELPVPKVDPGTPFRVQWTVLFSHRLTCRKEANPHFPKGSLGLQLCCVSRHSLSCRFPYPPVLNGVWLSSGKAVGRETEAKAPLVSLGYWGVLSVTNYYKAQFRKEKKILWRQYLESHRQCRFTAFLSFSLLFPPSFFDTIFTEPLYVHWAVYFLE